MHFFIKHKQTKLITPLIEKNRKHIPFYFQFWI